MPENIAITVDDTTETVSLVVTSGTVDSVFGRTGTVVAVSGDYDTDEVTEATNLYYTEARVSANTDVAANTAKTGITAQQTSDITTNNAKVSWTKDCEIGIAASDEATALTTGTAKVTFRMPYAMTLTDVRANVNTAPTGSAITVDINETATTILSTKLTIDATEKTSVTATTPPVISDSSLADDAEITIDIDVVGSTIAGAGLKIWLIGTRT